MVLSEPVSEALLPVYNQLSTLKRCLLEVKNSGGVNSPRELYPYSMKVRLPSNSSEASDRPSPDKICSSSTRSTTCGTTGNSRLMATSRRARPLWQTYWQSASSSTTSCGWRQSPVLSRQRPSRPRRKPRVLSDQESSSAVPDYKIRSSASDRQRSRALWPLRRLSQRIPAAAWLIMHGLLPVGMNRRRVDQYELNAVG